MKTASGEVECRVIDLTTVDLDQLDSFEGGPWAESMAHVRRSVEEPGETTAVFEGDPGDRKERRTVARQLPRVAPRPRSAPAGPAVAGPPAPDAPRVEGDRWGTRPTRRHALTAADVVELARGGGDRSTCTRLVAIQVSRRILQLRLLLDGVRAGMPASPALHCVEQSVGLLARARRRSSEAVDEVLFYPSVASWIMQCLRLLRRGSADGPTLDDDVGFIGGVAVAAAIRAGEPLDLPVHIRAGTLTLPTLGQIRLGGGSRWARVRGAAWPADLTISDADRHIVVRMDDPRCARWHAAAGLDNSVDGYDFRVVIEDSDPFRGLGTVAAAPGLSPIEIASWSETLRSAWHLLDRDHRHRLRGMSAALRAVVPLRSGPGQAVVSATSAEAVGAVLLARPYDPLWLAATLVHEFQHTKLSALCDAAALHDPGIPDLFYTPWRSDPRPVYGSLHGAYAFLGVAEFWLERWVVEHGSRAAAAAFEFAWARDAVMLVLRSLSASRGLTELGSHFVTEMTRRVQSWQEVAVPERIRHVVRARGMDTWITWRLRNTVPDVDRIDELAAAWLGGRPCPSLPAKASSTIPAATRAEPSTRSALWWKAIATARPDDALPGRHESAIAAAADRHYRRGAVAEAADAYKAALRRSPRSTTAWSGLALTRLDAAEPLATAYTGFPEGLLALSERLRAELGTAPDPDDLARWLHGLRGPS